MKNIQHAKQNVITSLLETKPCGLGPRIRDVEAF